MNLDKPEAAIAQSALLLVDDNPNNLDLLRDMLEWSGFTKVLGVTSGKEGISLLSSFKPDLIILDLMMPGMNGYRFLELLREDPPTDSFLPILVYTADLTTDARIHAYNLGASDFLTKPGDAVEISIRVRNLLQTRKLQTDLQRHNELLEAKVEQRTEHLNVARKEAVELLASACEYRDDDTGHHANRVGQMSAAIAAALGLDPEFVESIRLVAPLHDVGKIAVPDDILRKPGKLSSEEYDTMKRHAGIGADLLAQKRSPLLQLATEIARYHHERWDGKGYEAGLAGKAIPLSARIVTVADSFDAMTNDRPYRKARPASEALQELRLMSGSQFDPAVVEALFRYLEIRSEQEIAA